MPEDLEATYRAGVSVSALLDATYVCVGFNIVTRIANALGFKVPSEELLLRAARLLRLFGYRRLSGFWTLGSSNTELNANRALSSDWAEFHDPYASKMERLRHAVISSPGSLTPKIRQAISEGVYDSTTLGAFAQKVAEHAFMVDDGDIRDLHRAHYSDDQIFEAAVSAALGAGLYRLERLLAVLRANHSAVTTHGELPAQSHTVISKQKRLKVTA